MKHALFVAKPLLSVFSFMVKLLISAEKKYTNLWTLRGIEIVQGIIQMKSTMSTFYVGCSQ